MNISDSPAYCPKCYKLCKNDAETEKCINSHKNEPHNRPINKDSSADNIKPLAKKDVLATIKQYDKNLKECGLK